MSNDNRKSLLFVMSSVLLASIFLVTGTLANARNEKEVYFVHETVTYANGEQFNYEVFTLDKPAEEDRVHIENFVPAGFTRQKMPIVTKYNPANSSPSLGANDQAVISAAVSSGWNGISSNLSIAYGGLSSVPTSSSLCEGQPFNGENTINWKTQPGNIIGIACWWTGADECDIELKPDFNWVDFDLKTILWHELGHCIGLGHSLDSGSLMQPAYHKAYAAPGPDDVAGVCALYGGCGTVPPTATTKTVTPSFTQIPSVTPTFISNPTKTLIPVSSLTPISTHTPTPKPTVVLQPLCGVRISNWCVKIPFISKD